MLTSVSVAMPLSWDFIDCWFASFGGADQRQPEQGQNSGSGSFYSLADGCQPRNLAGIHRGTWNRVRVRCSHGRTQPASRNRQL